MGCSSCEAWLDRYLDGDLEPRRVVWLERHLDQCGSCERLLARLRVVDALLETVRPVELGGDFGAAVMSAVRELPIPGAPRRAWPLLIAGYLIAGWLVLAVAFLDLRSRAGSAAAALHGFERLLSALGPLSHSISSVTPWAVSAVVVVLAIDALLFLTIGAYYRRLAPRLALAVTRVEAR